MGIQVTHLSLTLPEGVDAEKINAEFDNVCSKITAPVAAVALRRRVEIKGLPRPMLRESFMTIQPEPHGSGLCYYGRPPCPDDIGQKGAIAREPGRGNDMRPTASASSYETPAQLSIEFLERLLRGYIVRNFRVRLWDGNVWGQQQQSRFTLALKHPGALRAMFLAPSELTLGEAYIYDDFDIEGDIEAALDLGDYLLGQDRSLRERLRMAELLRRLPASGRPRGPTARQPARIGPFW
jgi:hypothetical protein